MTIDERRREARLRNRAKRRGYSIVKSRAMLSVDNLGEYGLVDTARNAWVAGSTFDMSLDDIEEWLRDDEGVTA